jgi:hypothetical protein
VSAVATSVTSGSLGSGDEQAAALVDGFRAAFWVGVGVTAAGVVASLVFVGRIEESPSPGSAAAPSG